jgi:hypothetical protein
MSKLTLIIEKKCKCISHCRKLGVLYNFEINCTCFEKLVHSGKLILQNFKHGNFYNFLFPFFKRCHFLKVWKSKYQFLEFEAWKFLELLTH